MALLLDENEVLKRHVLWARRSSFFQCVRYSDNKSGNITNGNINNAIA